jgi:PleD family two-component response regulator
VASLAIAHVSGEGDIVTVSIGVAAVTPGDDMKQENHLITLADRAANRARVHRVAGLDCLGDY